MECKHWGGAFSPCVKGEKTNTNPRRSTQIFLDASCSSTCLLGVLKDCEAEETLANTNIHATRRGDQKGEEKGKKRKRKHLANLSAWNAPQTNEARLRKHLSTPPTKRLWGEGSCGSHTERP